MDRQASTAMPRGRCWRVPWTKVIAGCRVGLQSRSKGPTVYVGEAHIAEELSAGHERKGQDGTRILERYLATCQQPAKAKAKSSWTPKPRRRTHTDVCQTRVLDPCRLKGMRQRMMHEFGMCAVATQAPGWLSSHA